MPFDIHFFKASLLKLLFWKRIFTRGCIFTIQKRLGISDSWNSVFVWQLTVSNIYRATFAFRYEELKTNMYLLFNMKIYYDVGNCLNWAGRGCLKAAIKSSALNCHASLSCTMASRIIRNTKYFQMKIFFISQ